MFLLWPRHNLVTLKSSRTQQGQNWEEISLSTFCVPCKNLATRRSRTQLRHKYDTGGKNRVEIPVSQLSSKMYDGYRTQVHLLHIYWIFLTQLWLQYTHGGQHNDSRAIRFGKRIDSESCYKSSNIKCPGRAVHLILHTLVLRANKLYLNEKRKNDRVESKMEWKEKKKQQKEKKEGKTCRNTHHSLFFATSS